MALTGRFKILLAAALAVVIYIYATRPEELPGSNAASVAGARRSSSSGEQPLPAARNPATAGATAGRNVSSSGSAESARLFAQLSHRVSDGQSANALFKSQSWYTPPPPPPPAPVVAPPPPPAPTAPPLPFSVMGSYARPGDAKVYFLTRGERAFDVRVGDTIDNTYTVDGEVGGQLQLTYKPLNIQQTLALGGSQ